MERKAFTSLTEASMRVLLGETHMVGKTIIVNGKKGKVIEQVGSDGKTESDEIYKVKFEDGTVKDIPARDMEMQGDISNRKEPSENELEDIVNEGHDCAKIHPNMSHKEWKRIQKESVEVDEGILQRTKELVKDLIRNPRMPAPKPGDPGFEPLFKKKIDKLKKKNESVEVDESLGGPGGPSRQISPADMHRMVADRERRAMEREAIRKNKNKKKRK